MPPPPKAPLAARLAALRGGRAADRVGARTLTHLARAGRCRAFPALTAASIRMDAVAKQIGLPERERLSPLEIILGEQFERILFGDGAAHLLALYREKGELPVAACAVDDLRDTHPGRSLRALRARHRRTKELLDLRAAGHPHAPDIIVKPVLSLPFAGVERLFEPDYLVASPNCRFYRPGEGKSYPARRAKTDPADMRSALEQPALAVLALRRHAAFGGADPAPAVPPVVDVVLSSLGSLRGRLFPRMLAAGEVSRIAEGLDRAEAAAAGALNALPPGAAVLGEAVDKDAARAALEAMGTGYTVNCREFCPLAPECRHASYKGSSPTVLGPRSEEAFHAAGSNARALELAAGAEPRTEGEAALAASLVKAFETLRRIA